MDLQDFLPAAVYLLAVTAVCVALFRRIGLGAVLGLLVAGIIVGPYTPGPVATTEVEGVREFTHIGVVLLLFLIGLEMEPSRLWRMRREVFGLGLSQVLVTGAALGVYAYYFVAGSSGWLLALGIGLTFALSSTAFALQMLEERGESATRHGRTALSVLLMQDMAVVPLLALVPLLAVARGNSAAEGAEWPPLEAIGIDAAIVAGVLLAGRFVIPWALDFVVKQRNMDAFVMVALLAVLGAAWGMSHTGLSMELGAFAMGVLLSRTIHHHQLIAQIQPLKGVMMSLFFISVGMSIDVGLLVDGWGPILRDVVAIMAIKTVLLFVLCLAFGVSRTTAIRASFILAQCGEFGFVLFGVAHELGILGERAFLTGLVVIAASMMATPFFAKAGDLLADRWRERRRIVSDLPDGGITHDRHVVVAGYGRIGTTLCSLLAACDVPYVAFDLDHAKTSEGKRAGHDVYIGDIKDNHFLAAIGVGRAALVVITVDSATAMLAGVSHLRQFYPDIPVMVRVRDLGMADRIVRMGATRAVPETVEASLEFSHAALFHVGVPEPTILDALTALRADDYDLLRCPERELQHRLAEHRRRLQEGAGETPSGGDPEPRETGS